MDDNGGHAEYDGLVAGILMPYRFPDPLALQFVWGQPNPMAVGEANFRKSRTTLPPTFFYACKVTNIAIADYNAAETISGDWPVGPRTIIMPRVILSSAPLANITTKWKWYCSLKAALADRSWGKIIQFGQVGMMGGTNGVVTSCCPHPIPKEICLVLLEGPNAGTSYVLTNDGGAPHWTGLVNDWYITVWCGDSGWYQVNPYIPPVPGIYFDDVSCEPFRLATGLAPQGSFPDNEEYAFEVRLCSEVSLPTGSRQTACCENEIPVVLWLHYANDGDQWLPLVWDNGVWHGEEGEVSFNLRCGPSSTWEAQIDGGGTWVDFGEGAECDPFQLSGGIIVPPVGLLTCEIYAVPPT